MVIKNLRLFICEMNGSVLLADEKTISMVWVSTAPGFKHILEVRTSKSRLGRNQLELLILTSLHGILDCNIIYLQVGTIMRRN